MTGLKRSRGDGGHLALSKPCAQVRGIGAHVVRRPRTAGVPVVVLDDLSTGMPHRVPADVPPAVAWVARRHDTVAEAGQP
ncbi:hypothetical protein [Dactylosporangium sp. NPDC005555]|uniref:hypothetical protein n=1 Tax=Dactylosporangium sp. NPDC005555 TaxID=3154889 RepID=UPI0033B704AF